MRQLDERDNREGRLGVDCPGKEVFDDSPRILSGALGGDQNRGVQNDSHAS
jgi:hypothetical protein